MIQRVGGSPRQMTRTIPPAIIANQLPPSTENGCSQLATHSPPSPAAGRAVNGGAKVRRGGGRSKSAAPLRGRGENGDGGSALEAGGRVAIFAETQECTRTWTTV